MIVNKRRNAMLWGSLLLLALPLMASARSKKASKKEESKKSAFSPFVVYTENRSPMNHFIPSGWMGDYGGIKLDQASKENPYSGSSCIKITYNQSSPSQPRWAGIYWQDPANNWGEQKGGFNLTGAKKLTFWIRGAKGGEVLKTLKVGGIKGTYSDSDEASIGPVTLQPVWEQMSIPLEGHDLSLIMGGFCWATDLDNNPNGLTFYIDDIKFE